MTQDDLLSDLPTLGSAFSILRPGAGIGPGGRFQLEERAGQGGMGVVWRATDQRLQRAVALKFLPEVLASDPLARKQIEREASVMLDLTHPGIVRLLTLEEEGELLFLVMEYLEGPTLRKVLADRQQEGGSFSPAEARWLLAQAAPPLDHAHAEGVLHRDLKPANLMLARPPSAARLGEGDSLKVTDFGIAYVAATSFTQLTGRSHTSGTLPYMAPEVLLGQASTAASDVYALGATVFELVAGRLPFAHGDIGRQITDRPAPPLESGDPALDAAVAAALAKDPEDRPGSAGEFLAMAEGRPARPRRSGAAAVRLSRRRPLAWLAGVALVAAASWGAWALTGGTGAGLVGDEPGLEQAALSDDAAVSPESLGTTPPRPESPSVTVALEEPVAGMVTAAEWQAIRGKVAGQAQSAVLVQIAGDPASRKKLPVDSAGAFVISAFRLPETEGRHILEVLAADESVLLQCELEVDRTPPRIQGNPEWSPQGPARTGEPMKLRFACDEEVRVCGGPEGAAFQVWNTIELEAPSGASPDPLVRSIPVSVVDQAGNGGEFTLPLEVFDPTARIDRYSTQRPDRSPAWTTRDPEQQLVGLQGWEDDLRSDALLTEGEKHAVLNSAYRSLMDKVAREAAARRLNPFGWEVLDATPGKETGAAKKIRDPKTGITFILVEPGSFLMGSPADELNHEPDESQHRVTLTKAFYLGETEVTQAQWKRVMDGKNPSRFSGDDRLPVEQVSWYDCQEFLRKAGEGYRLPTEAEWEYACRAGSSMRFCFGDEEEKLGEYAWFSDNYGSTTHPVGQRKPNSWGFLDMHGNVWEWCQDRYGAYPSGPATDPSGPTSGDPVVLRGGSWYYYPGHCRSANRPWFRPDYQNYFVGFRAARTF